MSETLINATKPPVARRLRQISRTDSDLACEETAKLTAQLQGEGDDGIDGGDGGGGDGDDDADDDELDAPTDDDLLDEYQELPAPPDGGYGWVICFASFMCNMIVDGIAYTFGIFLSDFVEHFGEGKGKVAWVGSLLSGVYLSAGPIVSALANKYGCRTVCIAGSIVASFAFVLSTFATSVNMLMLTYGVLGGFGFGMIYLPAVVAVGYYFETKRSLATGIAVCGSGFGTFTFAPLATYLLEHYGWQHSLILFAGLILNCAVFGSMMRPLTYPKLKKTKPLMQRMYEEKKLQLERGSIGGSFFMVQLPDGKMEKRLKLPLNADPGVHSSLNLEQLAQQAAAAAGNLHSVSTLPTITEASTADQQRYAAGRQIEMKTKKRNPENDGNNSYETKDLPRNASQPTFVIGQHGQNMPKNVSTPSFERVRKISASERFKPSLAAIRSTSKDDNISQTTYSSKVSLASKAENRPRMVRPMSRKDIFYSGSVTNLPEYQSQKSLTNFRNSVLSFTKYERSMRDIRIDRLAETEAQREKYDLCPCCHLSDSFKDALGTMLDVSLLKDPVFMLIGLSNIFGMAGLYVPFVYLVDAATLNGIEPNSASLLLSIIGITNTFGRVICGYIADFPQVDSLLLNNICLVVSTIAVGLTPLCSAYWSYVVMAVFFGIAVSGYISLTSIILVDLLGLDKLTNAFGLLILFRGLAAILGSPLAGAVYDATQSYSISFYMAGGFFALSAVTSFIAPCMKRFVKVEENPVFMETLEPINEDLEEDIEDDDQPITLVPKLGRNLPIQPQPQQGRISPKLPNISNKNLSNIKNKDIDQIESVL